MSASFVLLTQRCIRHLKADFLHSQVSRMSIQFNSRIARHPLVTERSYGAGVGSCHSWGSRLSLEMWRLRVSVGLN